MESTNRRRRRQKGYPCNALRLLIRLWGIITSTGKKSKSKPTEFQNFTFNFRCVRCLFRRIMKSIHSTYKSYNIDEIDIILVCLQFIRYILILFSFSFFCFRFCSSTFHITLYIYFWLCFVFHFLVRALFAFTALLMFCLLLFLCIFIVLFFCFSRIFSEARLQFCSLFFFCTVPYTRCLFAARQYFVARCIVDG